MEWLEGKVAVRGLRWMLGAMGVVIFCGCGKGTGTGLNGEPGGGAASQQSVSMAVVDQTTAGSIQGIAVLEGTAPAVRPIDMSSAAGCKDQNSGSGTPYEVMTGENGVLANVVIYIKSGLGSYRFERNQTPVVLDQKGCMYTPRAVALMVDQRLEIRNDDPTIHNVHALAQTNTGWNKAQRASGPPLEVSFPRPERAIPFMCNVHPWMRAFVFVFADPYYAVTSKTGAFELKNLPPGSYTIEAWQEKLGTAEQTVTIGPRESKAIVFRFKS